MPREKAIEAIKTATERTYAKKGKAIVQKNFAAIDSAVANLHEVRVPAKAAGQRIRLALVPDSAPDFVRNVTATILAMRGDTLPVSALPVDGTYPVGTTRYEKRNIADEVPVWESELCIQCGQCAIVCPHSVIRSKYYDESRLAGAPEVFKAAPDQRARLSRVALHAADLPRRLHGMRRVRGELPGAQPDRQRGQGHQHEGSAPASRGRSRKRPLLRNAAVGGPHAREFRQRAGRAIPRAAVRILRRVCRVRRDAVSQADVAAVRRSAADRQRDRMLVDLRRQPADDPVGRERRRAWTSVGQFALRGQRRVRPWLSPRHQQPDRTSARLSRRNSRRASAGISCRRSCRPRR